MRSAAKFLLFYVQHCREMVHPLTEYTYSINQRAACTEK